ncbi:GNAT family N-acetyltransferase, partial [Staphylococcus felis]
LAVLDYAQSQGISEVYAIAAQSNRASIRVMEKIGMSKYDEFEKPKLNAYHPLKKQVRYQKVL